MADTAGGNPTIVIWLTVVGSLPMVNDPVYLVGPRTVSLARAIGRPYVGRVREVGPSNAVPMVAVGIDETEVVVQLEADDSYTIRPVRR